MADEMKRVLEKYKCLEVGLDVVKDSFGERMSFITDGVTYKLLYNPPVYVKKEELITVSARDFEKVLTKYLEGKVNERQLRDWANFVHMCDFYEIDPTASKCDRNVLLEILSRLGSPEINEKITPQIVRYFLECIKSRTKPR